MVEVPARTPHDTLASAEESLNDQRGFDDDDGEKHRRSACHPERLDALGGYSYDKPGRIKKIWPEKQQES